MKFSIPNYIKALNDTLLNVDQGEILKAIKIIKDKFINEKKIITCGNGGSAYNASHYITDWNKMINLATKKKFIGISLNDNLGLITAFANDINYNEVFSGQLKSILNKDDLVICISGSGNSKNVIEAANYANKVGAETLAFVGYDGGELKKICKNSIHVKSMDMQICEDIHLILGHMVMKDLCNTDVKN